VGREESGPGAKDAPTILASESVRFYRLGHGIKSKVHIWAKNAKKDSVETENSFVLRLIELPLIIRRVKYLRFRKSKE